MLGIGTYKLTGQEAYQMVLEGLRMGYRLIDTAEMYKNETHVQQAIQDSGIKREEITLITKIRKSQDNKQIEDRINIFKQIDCLLLHYPSNTFQEDWDWLCKNKRQEIKQIGVSNYEMIHLNKLTIPPYCNEIEISPFWQRKELVKYHETNRIVTIAHSPLTKSIKFRDPKLVNMCNILNMEPASVLIGWSLRQKFWTLTRTKQQIHLQSNWNVSTSAFIYGDQPMQSILEQMDNWDEKFATHPQHIYDVNGKVSCIKK